MHNMLWQNAEPHIDGMVITGVQVMLVIMVYVTSYVTLLRMKSFHIPSFNKKKNMHIFKNILTNI